MSTDTTDYEQDEAALPGLEPEAPGAGANERAARRTIAALSAADEVDEKHAVMCEALLTAARQLDRASNNLRSKDYGVAELIGQLREVYKVLAPEREEGGPTDAFAEFLDELDRERGTAPVRHPTE